MMHGWPRQRYAVRKISRDVLKVPFKIGIIDDNEFQHLIILAVAYSESQSLRS